MISIIVRTKNEERWIGACLDAIRRQSIEDVEIVLVDNKSTDKTVDKAMQFDVKLVSIDRFRPGAALNRGIEASSGDTIVCLSGHCIPVDETWLENLVSELGDETVGGVYGRQEPMAFSSDHDKRDLLITFGLDRREQVKDSFFHNANSAFRRSVWEQVPFDEEVTNIEDRLWAREIQKLGMKIVYEPSASVYHHHGIHHNGDPVRCGNIIRILESLGQEEIRTARNGVDMARLNTVAVVPIRDEGRRQLGGRPLYEYSIAQARKSEVIHTVVASVGDAETARAASAAGADIVVERGERESGFDMILELVMQATLRDLETQGVLPDILVMLEPTYPFRDASLLEAMVTKFVEGGFDTVIPARTEYNSCWIEQDGAYRRVDEGYIARQFKQPFFTGLKGLCCVCSPATVRRGQLFGDNVGLVPVEDTVAGLEVRSQTDMLLAETVFASPMVAERMRRNS